MDIQMVLLIQCLNLPINKSTELLSGKSAVGKNFKGNALPLTFTHLQCK